MTMNNEQNIKEEVNPFCDSCASELTQEEIDAAASYKNYDFPICFECFKKVCDKLEYVLDINIK